MAEHHALLLPGLDQEAEEDGEHREEAGERAEVDRDAQEHGDEPGVDRVAHEAVGAIGYELVPGLEGDVGAPVAAEDDPRPYGEGETKQLYQEAEGLGGKRAGK